MQTFRYRGGIDVISATQSANQMPVHFAKLNFIMLNDRHFSKKAIKNITRNTNERD